MDGCMARSRNKSMDQSKFDQSIGRSIRHVNDYASIVLIDKRYNDEKIRNLLPSWISSSISENSSSFYIFKEKLTKFHDSRTVYENSSIT